MRKKERLPFDFELLQSGQYDVINHTGELTVVRKMEIDGKYPLYCESKSHKWFATIDGFWHERKITSNYNLHLVRKQAA